MSLIPLLKINQGADTMSPLALLLERSLLYSRDSEVGNHHHCFQSVVKEDQLYWADLPWVMPVLYLVFFAMTPFYLSI